MTTKRGKTQADIDAHPTKGRAKDGRWLPGFGGFKGGQLRDKISAKEQRELRELAKQYTVPALNRLVLLMESHSEGIQLKAANSVLDRAYGKPPQSVYMNNDAPPEGERLPPSIKRLSLDERKQIVHLAEAMRDGETPESETPTREDLEQPPKPKAKVRVKVAKKNGKIVRLKSKRRG